MSPDRHTKGISRRSILSAGAATAVTAPMVNLNSFQAFASSPERYSRRTMDLMRSNLVVDMLLNMAPLQQQLSISQSPNRRLGDESRIDDAQMRKLRAMGIDVCHPARGISGYDNVLGFVARLNAYAAEHPNDLRRIETVADMDHVKAARKIGYIVGVQNSDHFRTVDDVNYFFTLGQRISQLTYNTQNLIATGSTDRSEGGVSDFGAQVIARMNQVGMAIDVSHCNDRTTLDAFRLSQKPVLITHSNARGVTQGHPRCKSDEAIREMARNGGVMGITGVRNFVSAQEPTTIENVIDHVDYVARLVGVEHVGVGSDMDPDGYDDVSQDLRDRLRAGYSGSYAFRDRIDTDGFDTPTRMYAFTERLCARGYSNADIALILGGNFRRVLGQIWPSARP